MNVFSKINKGLSITPAEQSFFKMVLTTLSSAVVLGFESAASYLIQGKLNLQLTLALGLLLAGVILLTGFAEFLLASKNPLVRQTGVDLQMVTHELKQTMIDDAQKGEVLFPVLKP